jgi:TfoX/Sxy family transcriptional regulator of competence genes
MDWKKVSPEMVALLDRSMGGFAADRRSMFGCPVYFVNNNMFAGVHQDILFFRLPEGEREALMALSDEVTTFEPMDGHKMKDYVVLPDSLLRQEEFLREWLQRSYDYVVALKAKERKAKKKSIV